MSNAKNHFHPMSLRGADLWHVLMLEGLNADCVPSPERQAWILATYPPDDMGRPGLFASPTSHCPENGQEELEDHKEVLAAMALDNSSSL